MKIPCCTVCQTRYNEEDRCPLLLDCGHGFCKDCLSRMFSSASSDTSISCPRCRHLSVVGNSVHALRKNYAILGLISSPSNADFTDDDDDDDEDVLDDVVVDRDRKSCGLSVSSSNGLIELGLHNEIKMVKRFGEEVKGGGGVEMWMGVLNGKLGRCRHRVAVKKLVVIGEGSDVVWMQNQLEDLRRKSMWCRNVCRFHGVTKVDGCLALVMDKCNGSVETEMQRNEGRLTLEQILRFVWILIVFIVRYDLNLIYSI